MNGRTDPRKRLKRWRVGLIAMTVLFLMGTARSAMWLYGRRKATEEARAAREYGQMLEDGRLRDGTVDYMGRSYRRSSNVKAILCIGVDRKGRMGETTPHTKGGQADGLFIVAQDTARNKLRFLIVPRDLMTEITLTDLSGNVLGKDIQHVNLAYAYGDGKEVSCERVAEALSKALGGFTFDHYIAADTDVIQILNDGVGGVTVQVPSAGMEKKDPAFVEGSTVTLKGEQAEAFVRYRDTEVVHSAIDRLEREKAFAIGFMDALQETASRDSSVVVELLEAVEPYMITDMGKEGYLEMARDAASAEGLEEKDFYIIPGQSVSGHVYDEFYADQSALLPILLELFYREV